MEDEDVPWPPFSPILLFDWIARRVRTYPPRKASVELFPVIQTPRPYHDQVSLPPTMGLLPFYDWLHLSIPLVILEQSSHLCPGALCLKEFLTLPFLIKLEGPRTETPSIQPHCMSPVLNTETFHTSCHVSREHCRQEHLLTPLHHSPRFQCCCLDSPSTHPLWTLDRSDNSLCCGGCGM